MDKRNGKRIHKIMRVNLQQSGKNIFGSIMDVSPGGMKVRLLTRKQFLFNQKLIIQITSKSLTYNIQGRVRWQKEDFIDHSHIVGIQFSALDASFCTDVLKQKLGSKTVPFNCNFESKQAFLNEFNQNIKHGGLRLTIKTSPPPLYEKIHINLFAPDRELPVPILAEVVAHIPGGVGLSIKNHAQVLTTLKVYD